MAPQSTTTLQTRPRPLSRLPLATALSASKSQLYADIPPAPFISSRRGPAPSNPTTTNTPSLVMRTLAWSPTGSFIGTADSKSARVWNPERPSVKHSTELKLAGARMGGTERLAWNPEREAEVASVGSDGTVRFWDIRTKGGLCVGEVKCGGEGFSLAWRPGGQELVLGRKDDTLIPIDRRGLLATAQYRQPVQTNQIAFTNSGRELLLTTGDSQVKILDYPSMEILHTLHPHTSSCYTVLPSPTGRHLAIGGSDALLTLWETSTFTCTQSLSSGGPSSGPIRSLSFTFDGSYVSGGSDEGGGGVAVTHVESGETVWTVPTGGVSAPCVAWHPSRYWIAWGADGGLRVLGAGGGIL